MHISDTVRHFYCRTRDVIFNFTPIPCEIKFTLMSAYCLD